MKPAVLLVDDDREAGMLLGRFLEGKDYRVLTAGNALEAIGLLERTAVDCVVLDVMMPEMDGFTALPLIRQRTNAPVLFLTGCTDDRDRIRGLTLGADDYIVKPCTMEELSLRIALNIRRRTPQNPDVLEFPPLRLELSTHSAYCGNEKLSLSNREYDLLLLFARNPGELLTFEAIGKALNGVYLESDRQTVMVNTSRLRKKLEQYPGLAGRIETVWGKGYRMRR